MTEEKAPQTSALSNAIEQEIERWFVETIHNSQVSRATEIYNHIREAVGQLKPRLVALIGEL
ncbi:hypothetical protein [Methylocystis heyeri]|uniref:Uncharacterized protein n=1 Tax=Methylocystis heyeri TaxID=391905 RepID=A0A6B8KE05_9HYPH|nr:hypothetical protein [Methylocystis heyeri]QGM45832.1 hypothetical protein H2LOC_009030 [Methylocystis heyeri]